MVEPVNTLYYMIAGFVVIFGAMVGYVVSLMLRFHRLRSELTMLTGLEKDKKNPD